RQLRRQDPALADPGLLFEACHQIDGVEVAGASASSHDIGGDRDGEVGLSCPRAANQHDIAASAARRSGAHPQIWCRLADEAFGSLIDDQSGGEQNSLPEELVVSASVHLSLYGFDPVDLT